MFKHKIFSRSSQDIKLYYSNWLAEMARLGYLSPERFKQRREVRVVTYKTKVLESCSDVDVA